jgi:hypothetical protein
VVTGALTNAEPVAGARGTGIIESFIIWGELIATGVLTWRAGSLLAGSGLFSEALRSDRAS